MTLMVAELTQPIRLDRMLRTRFPGWGRQAVGRLISAGEVQVNGRTVHLASWEVQNGDRVRILQPPAEKPTGPERFDERWLLVEEAELIVVDKPAGLLAEPTRWGTGVNLRDLAMARFGPLILFHRLDRDTSGVTLLTRSGPINRYLDTAFKAHTVQKEYVAVVRSPNGLGVSGTIATRLAPDPGRRDRMVVVASGGEHAVTQYAVVEERAGRQLVRLWPQTGRTHQLRVHLAHLDAPIVGDRLYGSASDLVGRLLLHAHRLTLPEASSYPARSFTAPVPTEFW
jgi:RluA family pseudouridine synthase